ncbi:hypothetical protein CfE428DRAFT_2631 [Chthoniobacter flavus Ellin428]|uniref:Uncharacterized protein n=1 Tax=Chthoniobacter flavus Ellin428 TaxID=497964 RepID=B4D130_9BACT|nr:hypothetical protein [Chthoniobacter flavus]EDY20042.1 hypothetical protein CfE428DRAFT_2631 [Chthoniobacter flavus Ellin428]TCO93942.1 hypothetical protein EV701_10328 [Chthoniobacter flavus]
MKSVSFPTRGDTRPASRAFTLLEVALIVAIIGMMILIIIGYLMAPKEKGPLPPVAAPTPIPPSTAPATPSPKAAATPAPASATPAPAAPPSTPQQVIQLSPQSPPTFR